MAEDFSEEEKTLLKPFVSNLDKPVFVLHNLPEVVKGALFSRYSRSTKSLRRTLLDEFIKNQDIGLESSVSGFEEAIATEKAEKFYDRVLIAYGDDSVAELAGAHIALEDISIIATKIVEDARIGLSPLEKSTRYVYFDQKENDKWRYYEEPSLMQSEFASLYTDTCNMLFETYAKLIPRLTEYFEKKMPKDETLSDRAYASTIRAKTCDTIRGLLPASTKTNMGFFGNGRSYEYLITKMYADELGEIKDLAASMQNELRTTISSFVKRPDKEHGIMMQNYLKSLESRFSSLAKEQDQLKQSFNGPQNQKVLSDTEPGTQDTKDVVLVDYDKDIENKIVAAALYPHSNKSMQSLLQDTEHWTQDKRSAILDAYVGERANRRHKPGRAFELANYTFDICANYGCYRDLHRHRVLTQQRQLLGCQHGYTLPEEIVDAGFADEFKVAMDAAKAAWEQISKKYPIQAQYVVPLAYNIRWQITMNLREAFHFCELRSGRAGHIDYRRIAQQMFKEIERVHPQFSKYMKFMDMSQYEFERLEAEKRIDKKLEELKK
jgi:thymidylate synthase ThyX